MVMSIRLREMAEHLAKLAPGRVEFNETSDYFSLDLVQGNPKNAVGIHEDYVTFIIVADELKCRVEAAGFDIRPKQMKKHEYEQDKFEIRGLDAKMIDGNEVLFQDLIESSIQALERNNRQTGRS